jgi:hypothetical protein
MNWDLTSVHESERVTPPKLRCVYSVDSRSVPQAARHISVSFGLLYETQSGEAVGPHVQVISDALAALHPEFESMSFPAT